MSSSGRLGKKSLDFKWNFENHLHNMSSFIHDDFLLSTPQASALYHEHSVDEPIFDYHCHLIPEDLANNRQYADLTEICLEGDHYKWRAMRLNGVDEKFCTGDATPYEKFKAWADTVPATIRNPLYHWTHLELTRYFGITKQLNPSTADEIWEEANAKLQTEEFSTWGLLKKFNVQFIGTTDDPVDSLEHHIALKGSDCPATVAPTFRPDVALFIHQRENWFTWLERLAVVTDQEILSLDILKAALCERIDFFDSVGCLASDHGLARCPLSIATDAEADATFQKALANQSISADEIEGYVGNLLAFLGEQYARKKWVMQLHLGAIRDVNLNVKKTIGSNAGTDSIGDDQQIPALAQLLGELSLREALPKTILYNLNPADNHAFATMCGNFFKKDIKGLVQYGSGWWFLDQMDGMKDQMNALSQLGLLSNFLGMLTDSRSMMSYPRHEYFRRILCQMLGQDMQNGLIPNDPKLIGEMVKNISYSNAKQFFG